MIEEENPNKHFCNGSQDGQDIDTFTSQLQLALVSVSEMEQKKPMQMISCLNQQ